MSYILSLESLQMFCDLVESQSFSRAADKNFVSQSAVSQRLRALERAYGQTLIHRGQGRGEVAPTEAGRVLYDGARRLLREAAILDSQVRGLSDEVAGTVRVATVYSVGLHALPPRLKPFLAAQPRVNIHLEYRQTGEIYQEVIAGSIDIGIVACPAGRRGIDVVPFSDDEMVVVCAPEHPLAGGPPVTLQQLEGQALIGFADDIPTRHLIDGRLRAAGVRVRIVMTFDNIETIKNLVEIGSGLSLLPADTVRQEVREGTLAAVPLAAADAFRRPAGLLVKKSRAPRAAVNAFLAAMRRHEGEPDPAGALVRP